MHELSIAQSLVASVSALAGPGERVAVVSLRIGALAGVDPQALRFAFPCAAAGTCVAGAHLEIEEIGLVAFCPVCDRPRDLPGVQRLRCPVCRTPTPRLLRGRELELSSVELLEASPAPAAPAA